MRTEPNAASQSPVEIAAGELQLRVWSDHLVSAVLSASNDPEISRWNPLRLDTQPGASEREKALSWISSRAKGWENHATWAVTEATSGDVLGYVSLHGINAVQRSAEVGYWTLPASRGRGIATAAVSIACRYGFRALDLHRIELLHAVDNAASCIVAERAGFLVEGTARQAYCYGDGVFHDDHMHARLASDPEPQL